MVAYEPGIEWAHVWEWYAALTHTRQVGMAANPITFLEVEAYCRLMRLVAEPWEVSAIIAIDAQVREHSAKKPAGGPKTESMSDGAAVKDVTSRVGKKRTIVVPQGELRKASG